MKTYSINFIGRLVNAIGTTYPCHLEVEAEDKGAAVLKLYDTHDHILVTNIREIERPSVEGEPK